MILGIGTDIVAIGRIADILQSRGERFARRILSDAELERYHRGPDPVAYLAKRFAGKEAVSKAFGTGIGAIGWHDIEIVTAPDGAPRVLCHRQAKVRMKALGGNEVWISLSDERDFAVAFAILS
ncbi:MAG: holo-ACP synthase [Porticoccaceae bacterium]|nr:holo-ACP synthase [Porticoccaceae bacterium]